MIAKNKKGKSFGGCVRYVMNEGYEVLVAEGVDANDAATITRDFAIQRSGRPEIKQPVGHIAVSFSPDDSARMTGDFMLKLAHEYMTEMGIGNTQYIVVRHHNTDHDHFHIVYNRIDNDLKLISVNNDYRRNVATCKKLKDRHGLTYGTDKEKVNRPKLTGADKVKYQIYDEIAANLPHSTSYADLEKRLRQTGITIQYKYRSGAEESPENIQGVSFAKGGVTFKGSAIDRKFSHANLSKVLSANLNEAWEKMKETITEPKMETPLTPIVSAPELPKPSEPAPTQLSAPETPKQPKSPRPVKKNPIIAGVRLSDEQLETLQSGGYIYLENLEKKDGSGRFSAYLFLNDDKDMVLSCRENPDEFIRYGRYEMHRRDKILVKKGHITRATVKWWGGTTARPYLWKENPADPDYKESWSDPRLPKEQLEKQQQELENRFRRTIPPPKKGLKKRR
jgi:hypothetical protein